MTNLNQFSELIKTDDKMEIIKPPETLADYHKIRESIVQLLSNKYADEKMFLGLNEKIKQVSEKIKTLEK
jgi:hypothetical protein